MVRLHNRKLPATCNPHSNTQGVPMKRLMTIVLTALLVAAGNTTWAASKEGRIVQDATTVLNDFVRSEEHTSELQSRFDLVCRLLLEKKNINSNCHSAI